MRDLRTRIFDGFEADIDSNGKEFLLKTESNLYKKVNVENRYDKLNNLLTDKKLQMIVGQEDVTEFIEYLRDRGFLPQNVQKVSVDPTVQLICNKSWCGATHYLVYAEAGAVVLAVAAATSVFVVAAASVVEDKDLFDTAVEIANIMGNKSFADKVKDRINDWVTTQLGIMKVKGNNV